MKFFRVAGVASALLCFGCVEVAPPPTVEGTPLVVPMAHGDHNPKNGGTVWMHGDLHFEVVLNTSGEHYVYFSDAYRVELPAAVASDVRITILRTGTEPEPLDLAIDEFGESWVVTGDAVENSEARAVVRFVHEGKPYEIELPFVPELMNQNVPDPHARP